MRLTNLAVSAPRVEVLSPDQLESIHQAALVLLHRTGVKFFHEQALKLLQGAGAHVKDGRAHMPPSMVQEALRQAPSSVQLYDRNGRLALCVDAHHLYFGNTITTLNITDGLTQERRRLTCQDVANMAMVADYLPNIDFINSGPPGDVHPDVSGLFQFQSVVRNTKKTMTQTALTGGSLRMILEMCTVVAGSTEALHRRPFFMSTVMPDSPLQFHFEAVEKLTILAELAIPVHIVSFPNASGTGPATLAGNMAVTWAETLAGLVLCQLIRPGAPCLVGGTGSVMDMSTGIFTYGSPERAVLGVAMGELAHYYGLPGGGGGMGTDSKVVDGQAAAEATLRALTSGLRGQGLVSGAGILESSLSYSHEMLVLGNEIIGMVKRCLQGIEVNDETLALEVIDAVGPGGNFIEQAHTLRHFKEHWRPRVMDRRTYQGWQDAGSPSLVQRLHSEVGRILAEHVPEPLPEDVERELANIIARETQRAAK